MSDHSEIGSDDVVVIASLGDVFSDALETGQDLARRGIPVYSTMARSLLDPDTLDFVRSSAARRVVLLCVQRGSIRTETIETIGGFLSTCQRYGKDIALRMISYSGVPFLSGAALASGWRLGSSGH